MSLMLRAIARATEHGTRRPNRTKVTRELFSTRDRTSVLGNYSIDSSGDTTLRRFGSYTVSGGRLRFFRAVEA
jgi:hypothetical protein